MADGVRISGAGKRQATPEDKYSIAYDFSEMHETGNYNDINYDYMTIEITKPDGAYLTTLRTDKFGITNRFYSKKEEEIIAWACSRTGSWEITEEYEVMDDDDDDESEVDNA